MRRLSLDLGDFRDLVDPHVHAHQRWHDHGRALTLTLAQREKIAFDLASLRLMSSWGEWRAACKGYDLLALNVRSYTYPMARRAAEVFKLVNPAGVVVTGGTHSTVAPAEMEAVPAFDHIVVGNSERSFTEVVRDPSGLPRVVAGKQFARMDDWPWIDRTTWPRPDARQRDTAWPLEPGCGWGPPPVASILTSRVCPWQCVFCLTDDTVIHTLAGQKTIRELLAAGEETFEVFSCDPAGNLAIGMAHGLRRTRKQAPVWKVILDDGTSFKGTADHPVLLRDGTYRPIGELRPDDSLMPFNWQYRRLGRSNGEYLWVRIHPERAYAPIWRWRLQREGIRLAPDLVVHHRNFDSKDNRRENLEVLTRSDHDRLHARLGIGVRGTTRSPETRRKMGLGKFGNQNSKLRKPESLRKQAELMAEYNRTRDYTPSAETRAKIAAAGKGRVQSDETRRKLSQAKAAYWQAKTPEERRDALANTHAARRLRNHRVVGVEFAGYEDVYDLTVDDYHNFAVAGGVFVHNCNEASYIQQIGRRSVENVIDELNWLDERYGPIGSVVIHDSMLFQQPNWLEEWLDKYPRKARKAWPYWAAARADTVRRWPELFEALVRETNWHTVSIGFESGSDRVLQILNKECTEEDNQFTIELLNRIGDDLERQGRPAPKFFANIMFGIPGERREDAFKTVRMLRSMRRVLPSIALYAPYPGSALGYSLIAEGKSLMTPEKYDRYPTDEKVKDVDYRFYVDLLGGRYDDVISRGTPMRALLASQGTDGIAQGEHGPAPLSEALTKA